MRETRYTDNKGRHRKVLIPDNAPESHAQYGLVVGPPDFDRLNLPDDVQTTLHNQLFDRGLFTYKDARARRGEIYSALQAALRVEVNFIMEIYQERENG